MDHAEIHPLQKYADDRKGEYSDEALAQRMADGTHPDSIRLIRSGHRRPSWELAFAIEAATGVSAHELRDPKHYRTAA